MFQEPIQKIKVARFCGPWCIVIISLHYSNIATHMKLVFLTCFILL